MLINDYYYEDTNINFNNSVITEWEQIFFKPKKTEFKVFFYDSLHHLPKASFLKKFRYKYNVENNDFAYFVKMLTRRGLLSKFRILFINLIKNIFFTKINNFFIKYINKNSTMSNYWLYSFFELLNTLFVFKLTFHRLDKNVRKYNRKRKIKIAFKYNYIPPFKRSKWTIKLIIKFSKFGSALKFYNNLHSLMLNIIDGKESNILYKLNIFTFKKIKNFSYQKTMINSI